MISIYEHNETNFECIGIAVLEKAYDVSIQRDINVDYRLSFVLPLNDPKYAVVNENMIVKCEGQIFRINRFKEDLEDGTVNINAMHIYSDTEDHHSHIQYIKNYMGYTPYQIMTGSEMIKEFNELGFHVLTPAELKDRGMEWLDEKIDFWEQTKTNANKVMRTIVENAGWGEIYVDNRNIAIVKRLGTDNYLRLDATMNMIKPIKSIEITTMVTRLYPYGQNDLHIGSVNKKVQYIDSPNISKYGVRKGYMDYSDIDNASDLLERAKWEFDERNENRIDIPPLTIEASAVDLSLFEEYKNVPSFGIGDTVYVYSKDLKLEGLKQRITSMAWYPYEPEKTTVRVGRVKVDLYHHIRSTYKLTHKYDKASNNNGDIKTNWLAGQINTDKNNVQSENKKLVLEGDLLAIKDGNEIERIRIGNVGNKFVFELTDKKGVNAVEFDENGDAVFKGTINTGKDCIIQGALRVGLRGANNGIEFYGDDYTSDSECYAKILPYIVDGSEEITGINVTDGKLCVEGREVATEYDIGLLKSMINGLESRIKALEDIVKGV